MRRRLALAALCVFVSAAPARADLINLGNGMIYDTLQDLTWMQDMAYVRTSGYDADGRVTYTRRPAAGRTRSALAATTTGDCQR